MLNATADNTWDYLLGPQNRKGKDLTAYLKWQQARVPNQEDRELAAKALEYARETLRGREDLNDYLYNLMVACSQATINHKLAGITASLMPHFIKEVERRTMREFQAKALANSVHAGSVGDRMIFRGVRVLDQKTLEGNYGTTVLHKMVDEQGRALTWFASTQGLGVGACVNIIGTVKRHDSFNGIAQTILSRVEVLDEQGLAYETEKAAKKAAKAAKDAAMTPEQKAAKEAKSAARRAKAEADRKEHRAMTTWCACGLLMKDCPTLSDHDKAVNQAYPQAHYILDYKREDARQLPDYQARVEAVRNSL